LRERTQSRDAFLFSLVVFVFTRIADQSFGTLRTKVILSVTFLAWCLLLAAQTDTLRSPLDSLVEMPLLADSTGQDSAGLVSLGVPISKDALKATVAYSADGYMEIDAVNEKIHLYDNALVIYQNITLRAAHIELSWAEGVVEAEGVINDTTGVLEGKPEFTEGQNTFVAERMRYNFETRKGIVYEVVTTEKDVTVRGRKSKFISAPPGDTTAHDIIYSQDAIFTTCSADHPHFGIRSSRQKVVAEKQVIIGPSRLEIMGVPTPLWLPFGFFPLSAETRSTGLIFPSNYENSEQFGLGLQEVGWFFPLGDHVNLRLTGDYYLQGSWGLRTAVEYRKRYRYNGRFNFRYDSRNQEQVFLLFNEDGTPVMGQNGQQSKEARFVRQNGITINLSHNQDAAAHPLNRLGGSINFQTNNNQSRVLNDFQSVTQNTINSNFSFSRNWQDKPMSMSVAFRHSQNTRTRVMNVDFPTFQFQTQALYPFRKKERLGPKRWYEDITMRYTHEARANFTATDTTFFEASTLEKARYGVQQ
ncbi:MAG: LPS-assembly protein LptD, partial [Bacteroidetes bacterium]